MEPVLEIALEVAVDQVEQLEVQHLAIQQHLVELMVVVVLVIMEVVVVLAVDLAILITML